MDVGMCMGWGCLPQIPKRRFLGGGVGESKMEVLYALVHQPKVSCVSWSTEKSRWSRNFVVFVAGASVSESEDLGAGRPWWMPMRRSCSMWLPCAKRPHRGAGLVRRSCSMWSPCAKRPPVFEVHLQSLSSQLSTNAVVGLTRAIVSPECTLPRPCSCADGSSHA